MSESVIRDALYGEPWTDRWLARLTIAKIVGLATTIALVLMHRL